MDHRNSPTPAAAAANFARARHCRSGSSVSVPSSPSTASPMLTVSGAPRHACAIRTEPAVRAASACAPALPVSRAMIQARALGLAGEQVAAAHHAAHGLREPAERRRRVRRGLNCDHAVGIVELEQQQRQRHPSLLGARVSSSSSAPIHTLASTVAGVALGVGARSPASPAADIGGRSGTTGRARSMVGLAPPPEGAGSGSGRRCVPGARAQ